MERAELFALLTYSLFTITIIGSVWLIKRVKPSNRIYWFIGYLIAAIPFLGIIRAPIAVIATLLLLAFTKKNNDNPLADIGSGLRVIIASSFYIITYSIGMLLSVGGIYWLWIAIQLKSFSMFLVGIFPVTWIVTAPVGAYSLIMQVTPQWIIEWFS